MNSKGMDVKDDQDSSAQWALDLLEPIPGDYQRRPYELEYGVIGSLVLSGPFLLQNYLLDRPLRTRIYLTIPAAIVGGLLGCTLSYMGTIRSARQDAIMRDYIKSHPERFPHYPLKTFADLFIDWQPIR